MLEGIKSFKGRNVEQGKNVKVYFDLHRKTFSIQIGQLVHGKADALTLKNASFKVNEKDRMKVVKTGVKNVHAKVHGEIYVGCQMNEEFLKTDGYREAAYNPFKYESFVDKETEQPIESAEWVHLQNKRIFYK